MCAPTYRVPVAKFSTDQCTDTDRDHGDNNVYRRFLNVRRAETAFYNNRNESMRTESNLFRPTERKCWCGTGIVRSFVMEDVVVTTPKETTVRLDSFRKKRREVSTGLTFHEEQKSTRRAGFEAIVRRAGRM